MSIDLKSLRCFVSVAELGNVTRAAEAMHMTQPALSLRLKQLAAQTGLALFKRSARGLTLTEDGIGFGRKAARVLAALDEMEVAVRHLHKQIRGTLRIGTVIDPEFIRLGAFLGRLVEVAPMLEKQLRQGMSGNVPEWLLRGEIDAGFFLGKLPSGPLAGSSELFVQKTLTRFAYWVIAPRGWEARVHDKGWEELAQLPWIGTADASVHHRLLEGIYSPLRCRPKFVAMVDQESSMLAMVRAGVGLSLCRDAVALSEMRRNGLVVNNLIQIACPLSFIALRSRRQESAIACTFDVLGQVWSDLGGAGPAGTVGMPVDVARAVAAPAILRSK